MTVHGWQRGTSHTLTEAEWAEVCASFLGSGFRLDLPSGTDRGDAARHEAGRVRRLAEVIGAELVELDWTLATASLPDQSVEVVGGWPRTYAGESAMWIAALPVGDDHTIATVELLSSPRQPSPTSGLPMFSRLADEVAQRSLRADAGLWADADGSIVASTAGPIIAQRADQNWALGSESGSWWTTQIAAQRDATADLRVEDLASALFIGVIGRRGEIQPVTYLSG